MDETLDEVKERLSGKYLGKAGIHSLGISRAENAVRVYLEPDDDEEVGKDVLTEIEKDAEPYKVIMIQSGRSSIS